MSASPAGGRLAPCPGRPNCVSSDDASARRRIDPLRLKCAPAAAWPAVRTAVAALPRATITRVTDDRLEAEFQSPLFGFVDDLVLELRPADGIIAARSAARLGYWDLGVNRRRVETLRALLRARGVVE